MSIRLLVVQTLIATLLALIFGALCSADGRPVPWTELIILAHIGVGLGGATTAAHILWRQR